LSFEEESDAEIAKLRSTLTLLDQFFPRTPAPKDDTQTEVVQAA
jgi:hypothetical protein